MSYNLCSKCVNLSRYCRQGSDNITTAGLESRWRACFRGITKEMGFNKKQTDFLWMNLVDGNWEKLHITDKEKDEKELLKNFASDVFYCSDRWSFDRLCRNHWRFRQYMRLVTDDYLNY